MFIAALLVIASTGKTPQCSSTNDKTKMWYVYKMAYYSLKQSEKSV